jgi:hypothetical protein
MERRSICCIKPPKFATWVWDEKMSLLNEITFRTLYILILFAALEAKDNIMFIVVDDLRPALECYGDTMAHTPNFNALAKSSIYFNNAYVQVRMNEVPAAYPSHITFKMWQIQHCSILF